MPAGCTRGLRESGPRSRRARPCRGLGRRQAPIPVACDEAAGADAVGLRRSEPYHRHRHDLRVEQDGRSGFTRREETGGLGRSARDQGVYGHPRAFEILGEAHATCPAASMVSKLVVTWMMRPHPRLIMGSAANRAIRNAPIVLIARMRCQPSGSASKNLIRASSLCPAAVDMLTTAQLIRMSSAPKVSITC